ncbi:MAG: HAD-IIIC family phosphatase [Terriglobia bacterium]
MRLRIDEAVSGANTRVAQILLADLWRRDPRPATANFVNSRFERLRPHLQATGCRVAFLRSFTLEPVAPSLRAEAAVRGLDITVQFGGFNAYAQDILDGGSNLYAFSPDIAVIAVQTRDIAPELWSGFPDLSAQALREVVDRISVNFRQWVEAFRSRSQAHLIIHTLEVPEVPANGILDAQSETGQMESIRSINLDLMRLARDHSGVYLLDYDGLAASYGRSRWHDEEKWLTMRMPISSDAHPLLVNEYMRFLCPLMGKICKALVVDLDNTLWGGVVGEDGFDGIRLGAEYPGAAYLALQRAILDLHQRGVILAIASKNNLGEAMDVIERHPHMLLRPEHFSAVQINWNDKAQSLRAIAAELSIGTDSLAFLDDSETERYWVRSQMPEVAVIDMPETPLKYAEALRRSPVFDRLKLSAEDRLRSRYYAEDDRREELKHQVSSLEDFYRSLAMEAEVSTVSPQTLARVAQLTQKTNQFNLTTRRYTEQQISTMAAGDDWRWYTLRLRDRFGDTGLVAVAGVHRDGIAWEIDTFLMSCRVIGRTAETALLAVISEHARREGGRKLMGWFLPTKKNAPAKDFYPSHGFVNTEEANGASRWEFDLTTGCLEAPPWIRLSGKTVSEVAQ